MSGLLKLTSVLVLSLRKLLIPWTGSHYIYCDTLFMQLDKTDTDFKTFTQVDFFIMSISFSDAMSGLTYCVAIIWSGGDFRNSPAACSFFAFTTNVFSSTSLVSLFLLALTRYAIVQDAHHKGCVLCCLIHIQ